MNDLGASPRSISRSIAREGKRWEIVPEIQGDHVKASAMVHFAECRNGMGDIRKAPMKLCTVDEEHPFAAVLGTRVANGCTDLATPYKRHDELVAIEQRRAEAELDDEIKAEWKTRKRMSMYGSGLFVPAGLAERKRRLR